MAALVSLSVTTFSLINGVPLPCSLAHNSLHLADYLPPLAFLLLLSLGGYFLGSIPFGLVLTKLSGLKDIRQMGSGNIGATNVLRTGGKKLAALTLLFDALKGALGVLFVQSDFLKEMIQTFSWLPGGFGASQNTLALLVATTALLGHLFPFWLSYKGGKGIATLAGLLISLSPLSGGVGFLLWGAVFWKTKISSLAAIITLILLPIASIWIQESLTFSLWLTAMSLLLLWRHKENINRLLSGQERPIKAPSQPSKPDEAP